MPAYRIPDIICFKCPLYGKERECGEAQMRASTIRTHGVCKKIEYDIKQRQRILGDPQVAANLIVGKAKKRRAATKTTKNGRKKKR